VEILGSLELQAKAKAERKTGASKSGNLEVTVPTFRPDLGREIDLVEEIVRLHGYNKVKSTLPESSGKRGGLTSRQRLERETRDFLISTGLREVITYGFINPGELDRLGFPEDSPLRRVIELLNPLSGEQSIMRPTLMPGVLSVVRHNVNREQENVQIFEMGRVFERAEGQLPKEALFLAGALTGNWSSDQWYMRAEETNFFDVKGILDALFRHINVSDWHLTQALHPAFHPGRCAEIIVEKQVVGVFGEIRPQTRRAYGLSQRIQVFDLNLDRLFSYIKPARYFQEIPRFPGVSLDMALEVDEHVRVNELEKVIIEKGGRLLRSVHLFDLYQGEQLEEGKKSVAYSLYFRADDRTLDMEEIKRIHGRMISKLKELGAELRS
jgi:phenylalanyl-tRNA synthetase beta chain